MSEKPSQTPWVLVWVFLLLVLGISLTGYWYYFNEKKKIKVDQQNELSLIARTKADRILNWRQERIHDGELFFKNPFMAQRIKEFLKNPKSFEVKQEMLGWMVSLLRLPDYSNVFLLDPKGRVRLTGGNEDEGLGKQVQAMAVEAIKAKEVFFSDLVQDELNQNIHLDLLVPIISFDDPDQQIVGLVIIRIDPYQFLYPLVQAWPTSSQTSETLLVRRDGEELLCLNVLRHQKQTAFVLRIPFQPPKGAQPKAIPKTEGIFEFVDYRSVPVLGSLLKIPHSPWILLSKIDSEEIFKPVREMAKLVITLGCLLVVVAGTSLGFYWRHRKALFYRQQYEIELEKKRAEAALRESEANYRAIYDAANDAIFVHDMDTGAILDLNQKGCEMYGHTVAEVRRLDVEALSAGIPPYTQKDALRWITSAIHGEAQLFEWLARDNAGRHFWVEVNLKRVAIGGQDRLLAVVRDISERKKAEEERNRLEERLRRAEKMEALGTLAGGVAHDLNNVLGVLVGYSELLMLDVPEGSPLRDHTWNILQAGQRATAIIQDLLTLARRGVAISEITNLNRIISDFLKTPEFDRIKSHHPDISFRMELDPALLNIKGSPVHLDKTVMNLVSNAAEAVPGPGEVVIRTENQYIDKPIPGYEETREGEYALLMVSDTGSGIPPSDLGRIFEPFYTKKVMGRSGTGLGLAVVWGTIKDHSGYIDVQSQEGKGSTFLLYFPVTREAVAEDRESIPRSEYTGRGESILVVDDVEEQRVLAATMLGSLGYKVDTAAGGKEAVDYLKSHRADLLVLDMIMDPGIDGLETYRRILEIHPGQRAVIVSGFSETDRLRQAQALGAGAYVRKPYLLGIIGEAVRRELDRKS